MIINTLITNNTHRIRVSWKLSQLFADEYTFGLKTVKLHFHFGKGQNEEEQILFSQYKLLLDNFYKIGQQIVNLPAKVPSTSQELIQLTRLREYPGQYHNIEESLEILRKDHSQIIAIIVQDIEEISTLDISLKNMLNFLLELKTSHERMASEIDNLIVNLK